MVSSALMAVEYERLLPDYETDGQSSPRDPGPMVPRLAPPP